MRALIIACAMMAATPAFAQDAPSAAPPEAPAETQAPAYEILETDARLPFSNTVVRNFRVGTDGSLLIEASRHRWYRAELEAGCSRDLRWDYAIRFDTGPGSHTLDKFGVALIEGRRCHFRTFDRIADPGPQRAQQGEG